MIVSNMMMKFGYVMTPPPPRHLSLSSLQSAPPQWVLRPMGALPYGAVPD